MKSTSYFYYKCQYRKDWSSIFNLRKKRSKCLFFRFTFRTSNKKGIKIFYASILEFDCLGHYKSQMHQEIANFIILLCKPKSLLIKYNVYDTFSSFAPFHWRMKESNYEGYLQRRWETLVDKQFYNECRQFLKMFLM